jgi:hypothetical protein
MDPQDDRIARRREEIRAEEAALDRPPPPPDPADAVVDRRRGNGLRSAAFLAGVILLAAGLLGTAVTLSRLAGSDFGDAERLGRAQVASCERRGPITNKGFGTWDSCTVRIVWDDGDTETATIGAVFTSADEGTDVRVGDLGRWRTDRELARADAAHRPWLAWIGYAAGLLAFLPALVAVLILRELLRFRRR